MPGGENSPIKIVLNVWAIIGIIVSISAGAIGVYVYLDQTFAKLTKLEAEKTALVEQLQTEKNALVTSLNNQKVEHCRLHYKLLRSAMDAEWEEALENEDDLKARAQLISTTSQAGREQLQVLEGLRRNAGVRLCTATEARKCLDKLRNECSPESRLEERSCEASEFLSDCRLRNVN